MKLKLALASLALLALPTLALASPITYPGSPATDASTGAAVTSGVTATVASVTDLDGNAKSASLAAAHVAGGNTSAVYDAAANGEAWVTLSLSATGHTFSPVVIFCSSDPSTLASNSSTLALVKPQTDKIGTAAGQAATAPAWYTAPAAFPATVIVGGYAAGQDPLTLLAASFTAIPAAVENFNVGGQAGTLTKRVSDAISSSVAGGSYLPGGINLTTHTQAVTYYLPGTTLAAMNAGSAVVVDSALVTYDVTNTKILSRVDTPGTF